MQISVIMVDGGFRQNIFGAKYLSLQDFDPDQFEIIWVEFYTKVPDVIRKQNRIKVISLNNDLTTTYHSSFCFNKGIAEAQGELIVIPDADQIFEADFLNRLWTLHKAFDRLVVYPYRLDETSPGSLLTYDFGELKKKCVLKNPTNYGGCLSVRKKWLLEINGYEQHSIFESGFHANGLDIYTRLKNLGLAVMWAPEIKMYHPWHPFTLSGSEGYKVQFALIDWRAKNLQYHAISGISKTLNYNGLDTEDLVARALKSGRNVSTLPKGIKYKIRRFVKKYFY